MGCLVLLRGVNVGGRRRFRPREFADSCRDLDLRSVGAAGSFLAGGEDHHEVAKAVVDRLQVTAQVLACPADELLELVESDPHPRLPRDGKRFATLLAEPPRSMPELPVSAPDEGDWQVRLLSCHHRFVVSHWRRREGRLIYPNEVVERRFDVPATTRGWNTLVRLARLAS